MTGRIKSETIRRWLPAFAWMALIFLMSSQSQPPGPADPALDFIWKKGVHVASYALLAHLLRGAIGPSPRAKQWAWMLTLLYAISDEFHQSFVPGRTARATDVAIDMVGATIGLYVLRFPRRSIAGTTRSLRGHHDRADDEPSV